MPTKLIAATVEVLHTKLRQLVRLCVRFFMLLRLHVCACTIPTLTSTNTVATIDI